MTQSELEQKVTEVLLIATVTGTGSVNKQKVESMVALCEQHAAEAVEAFADEVKAVIEQDKVNHAFIDINRDLSVEVAGVELLYLRINQILARRKEVK